MPGFFKGAVFLESAIGCEELRRERPGHVEAFGGEGGQVFSHVGRALSGGEF
jgi:hypothetical protein